MIRVNYFYPWFIAFLFLISLQACSSTKSNIENAVDPLSPEAQELALGREMHSEILSKFYAYTEPRVVAYVEKIGESLAKEAERQELDYKFTILYNDKIYAASSPGGYVYITTGMINFLDNESELAGVIAHEVGQLQYRMRKSTTGRKTLDSITKTGTMIGPFFGQFGALASLGLTAVNAAVTASDPDAKDKLEQADFLALTYMVKAGYDPQSLIDVMHKFLNADKEQHAYFHEYYQSRPITEARFKMIETEFAKLPIQGRSFETNFETYQKLTKGIRQIYAK